MSVVPPLSQKTTTPPAHRGSVVCTRRVALGLHNTVQDSTRTQAGVVACLPRRWPAHLQFAAQA
jgi:hypothetical protein